MRTLDIISKLPENMLRRAVAIASLLLISVYFFPLWQIELWAPQYPEGLFMTIWINRITGDIRNINILNHYIGMKKILPADFPELRLFAPVFGGLIATGLAASLSGKRVLMYLWIVLLLTLAVAAAADFYNWEYRFGHELSPDAAIKVEGMAYQPPLIGVRSLLNISAWSLPGLAGYCVLLSTLIAGFALAIDVLQRRRLAIVLALFAFAGCSMTGPSPIDFGHDQCGNCKMTITDHRFGGELVTKTGKTYKFDALECMSSFMKNQNLADVSIYVLDATNKGKFIAAEKALFLRSKKIHAPMGDAILAAPDKAAADRLIGEAGTTGILTWSNISQSLATPLSSPSH
mgnify:CR=1 FL=1